MGISWIQTIEGAMNSLLNAAGKSAVVYTHQTRANVIMGDNFYDRILKLMNGPAHEEAQKLVFDTRRDAVETNKRSDLKSKCGYQQKVFTFLESSTFLDYRKVGVITQLDSHEL